MACRASFHAVAGVADAYSTVSEEVIDRTTRTCVMGSIAYMVLVEKGEIGTLKDLVCSGLPARSRMPMPRQSNFVNVGGHGAHKRGGAARLAESVTGAQAKDTAGLELASATKGVATARAEALVPKARCEAGHHVETWRTRASLATP